MSNEREDRVEDARVAESYRTLAQERAPDHLSKKVLRMAARQGRTPYSRARAWMRPAAWAATIALSLAIVLELTRLPEVEPELVDIATPRQAPRETTGGVAEPRTPAAERADSVSMDTFAPKDMSVLREAENRARAQAGPDQLPSAPRADAGAAPAVDIAARQVSVGQDRREQFSDQQDANEPAADKRISAAASLAVVASDEKALELQLACPAKLRESARSWFACIQQLRDSGQEELADSEYEEFRRIFPDFVDSGADK
jgi:hypothetical protein